jgi:hypothetical protein
MGDIRKLQCRVAGVVGKARLLVAGACQVDGTVDVFLTATETESKGS